VTAPSSGLVNPTTDEDKANPNFNPLKQTLEFGPAGKIG
jgi:hypothetical protein